MRTSYDVLPLSYRLIVFDTGLLVKKSLNTLVHQGIVSAPLWDSQSSTFAGLLTTSDYLNVVQYYWQNPDALAQVDQFKLNSLRDIERAIGVAPIETVSINPNQPLYDACRRMLQSRARRIPLIDVDDETQREMVVSVVTQYRILKFVSVNVKETQSLKKPLWEIGVGTFENLATATMDTPVMDVIHMLVKRDISSVPILDRDGTVLNVFEAVDVIALIKGGDYENLNLSVGKALEKRSEVWFFFSTPLLTPFIFLRKKNSCVPLPLSISSPGSQKKRKEKKRHRRRTKEKHQIFSRTILANSLDLLHRTSPVSTPARSTTGSTPSSTRSGNPACTASSSSTSAASLRA